MGCDHYAVGYWIEGGWGEISLMFNPHDDTRRCLCSFPHNYRNAGLDARLVRSLAYLGAAVAMAHHGDLALTWEDQGYRMAYLPDVLPNWVREEIDRQVPEVQ